MEFRLLSVKEAAGILGMTPTQLRTKIRRGTGPKAVKTGPRSIVVRMSDLREWFNQLEGVNRPFLRGGPDEAPVEIDLGEDDSPSE